jgi:hypothetical protein
VGGAAGRSTTVACRLSPVACRRGSIDGTQQGHERAQIGGVGQRFDRANQRPGAIGAEHGRGKARALAGELVVRQRRLRITPRRQDL